MNVQSVERCGRHVAWEFIDTSEHGIRRSLNVFSKRQPPTAAEFKGFYGFTDAAGVWR
jgi:hypothetical protein